MGVTEWQERKNRRDRFDVNKQTYEENQFYLQKSVEGDLARSDEEAEEQFQKFREKDPCPDIAPALLNSADIYRYVEQTGMIYPFKVEKLEGASYEVSILGTVVWWDEESQEKHQKEIKKGEPFELKPNSIAFVTLEPTFRIPSYIALRFNLKIKHIYKGLLLGTDPLVDPGFVGKLSIPLHNLTSNTYVFRGGDGIIQMEFTKLSNNCLWSDDQSLRKEPFHVLKWLFLLL